MIIDYSKSIFRPELFQMYQGDLALCCFLIGGYDIDSATSMSWVSGEDLAYTNWFSHHIHICNLSISGLSPMRSPMTPLILASTCVWTTFLVWLLLFLLLSSSNSDVILESSLFRQKSIYIQNMIGHFLEIRHLWRMGGQGLHRVWDYKVSL